MVLFEDIDGDSIAMKGDDDSGGFDSNAPDQGSQLRIRLFDRRAEGDMVGMMW